MARITPSSRTEHVLSELGRRLRRVRLDQNRTIEEIANESGVGESTIERMERGDGSTLKNFVRVLRSLGRLGALENFLPEPTVSPLSVVEQGGKRRQRASGSRGRRSQDTDG